MRCINFKELARGSLIGFADIELDSGLILRGCTYHQVNGKRWCNPPGRPQLNAERQLVLDGGKVAYAPVVEFVDSKIRFKWSVQAVAAIQEFQGKTPAEASVLNGKDTTGGQPRESC